MKLQNDYIPIKEQQNERKSGLIIETKADPIGKGEIVEGVNKGKVVLFKKLNAIPTSITGEELILVKLEDIVAILEG